MKQLKTIIPPGFGVDLFFSIDPDGHIIGANHSAKKITVISSDDLAHSSFAGLFKEPAKAAEMLKPFNLS